MTRKHTQSKAKNALTTKESASRGRELVRNHLNYDGWNSDVLFEKAHDLMEVAKKGNKRSQKAVDELQGEFGKTLIDALSLDTGALANLATNDNYRPFLNELIIELKNEYGAQSASEKAIIQMAALSYVQFIRYSNLFNVNTPAEWTQTHELLSILSKEVDRSHRRFTTCIQMLKHMKEPSLKVNVKAQNAFVAQNQQINDKPQDEINTPQ